MTPKQFEIDANKIQYDLDVKTGIIDQEIETIFKRIQNINRDLAALRKDIAARIEQNA